MMLPILLMVAMAEQEPREIEVRVSVPTSGWSISIVEMRQVEDEIWAVSKLSAPPQDALTLQVINDVSHSIYGPWPDLPVHHFVIGRTWRWEDDEMPAYTFIGDWGDLPEAFAEGELLFND